MAQIQSLHLIDDLTLDDYLADNLFCGLFPLAERISVKYVRLGNCVQELAPLELWDQKMSFSLSGGNFLETNLIG